VYGIFKYKYDTSYNFQLPAHAQGSPQAALQAWPQAGTRWPHGWSHTSREQGAAPHFRPHFRWAQCHTHFSRQEERGDSPHRPLLVPWGQLQKKTVLGIRIRMFQVSRIRIRIRKSQLLIRLRILTTSSKNSKENLDSFCFVTSL
jgi:hypothetical protein